MPSPCLSITAARDYCYSRRFLSAGLRPTSALLPDGAAVHLWVPSSPDPSRFPLLLLHGFGASATWQWAAYLKSLLCAGFDLYVPDLLFFGSSSSPEADRSDYYQARSVIAAVESVGLKRFGLAGVSYGGFVAYRIAEMYPERVERVVLICAGVCLQESDLASGLFVVRDVEEAAEILLPRRPDKLKELVRLTFCKPPRVMPTCFIRDYIEVMCTDYVKEKTELLHDLIKDRKLSDLPKITQPTLILWGEQDRVFPLELAYRLKRHLEENSELVVIKNAGHAVNLEKSREVCEHIKVFFLRPAKKVSKGDMATRWNVITRFAGFSMRRLSSRLSLPKLKQKLITSSQCVI
ncbi:uncharacterized protein [Typha angustifolia]|uniref:uncharacterized protein isoform X1 n=1 Tax=Typha angustifolia TaxID=59011 RepID=UPI003C30E69C